MPWIFINTSENNPHLKTENLEPLYCSNKSAIRDTYLNSLQPLKITDLSTRFKNEVPTDFKKQLPLLHLHLRVSVSQWITRYRLRRGITFAPAAINQPISRPKGFIILSGSRQSSGTVCGPRIFRGGFSHPRTLHIPEPRRVWKPLIRF